MTAAIKKNLSHQTSEHIAMRDWLSSRKSGHLGPYMYTNDLDDHRWKEGHSSKNYYVGRDDKATFDLMIQNLNVLTETLFDLGPGGEDSVVTKSIPITEATLAAKYIAIDLSPTLAYGAADLVSQKLQIPGTAVVDNFFDQFPFTGNNALIALMGGTLGNLETHHSPVSLQKRLMRIFLAYRNAISRGGFFLVSFDANSNGKEILDCYDNPQLDQLVNSSIQRSIDTNDFEYYVSWAPHNYQLALGLRSKRAQAIHFNGEQFYIEQDEFLPVLNSYRFPIDFVIKAAAKAGWAHWKTWSATGRIHYLLFTSG